jgi:hypothetical protein
LNIVISSSLRSRCVDSNGQCLPPISHCMYTSHVTGHLQRIDLWSVILRLMGQQRMDDRQTWN